MAATPRSVTGGNPVSRPHSGGPCGRRVDRRVWQTVKLRRSDDQTGAHREIQGNYDADRLLDDATPAGRGDNSVKAMFDPPASRNGDIQRARGIPPEPAVLLLPPLRRRPIARRDFLCLVHESLLLVGAEFRRRIQLRYCNQPLRRSKLDSRFGISHPPISRYCKLLRGILVRAMQIDTKSTHGQIVRS